MKAMRDKIKYEKIEAEKYLGVSMSEQPSCLNCGQYDYDCKCPADKKKILKDVPAKGKTEK